jgi:serine/threonine protein kinase
MNSDSQVTQIMTPAESRAGISIGDVLRGRYRLDSQIGRGGMGIVYRATDLELAREVAIKVISEASSQDSRDRFIREARAAAALNHPKLFPFTMSAKPKARPSL